MGSARRQLWGGIAALLLAAFAVAGTAAARPPGASEEPATRYVARLRAGGNAAAFEGMVRSIGGRTTGEIPALRLVEVEIGPEWASLARAHPAVAWIHPEGTLHVSAARPNDPLFNRQWPLRTMDAVRGWEIEDGRKTSVIVAVIDSGIDPSHPDLQNRMTTGFDFVNLDGDPVDDHGHGTHVAGIIAAAPNNRRGIAGISWGASLMPLKACDFTGACGSFEVAAAIAHAAGSGAKVVNISLGADLGGCPSELQLAGALANASGVVLVASAGNSAQQGNPRMYPAGCDGYVGVGATTPQDTWAPFSEHNDDVDVSAPGVGIYSTIPPGLGGMEDYPTTPGYGPASGTSMAAPHVAGLAALLFAQHPEWAPADVERRLEESAVDLGKPGRDEYFGAGRISIARALGAGR